MCRAPVVVSGQRLHAISVAGQFLEGGLIVWFDHPGSMEDVCRLAEHQPEVRPVDQEVVEVDEALAAGHACGDLRLVMVREWGPEPAVDAAVQLGQFDLHVDRRCQFGVPDLQRAELGDLAGFDATGAQASRSVGRHGGILVRLPAIPQLRHALTPGSI